MMATFSITLMRLLIFLLISFHHSLAIINGTSVVGQEYKFMASLSVSRRSQVCPPHYMLKFIQCWYTYEYIHVCGATILSSRYLLTAAHCVENYRGTELYVSVGSNRKRNPPYLIARKRIVHPQYRVLTDAHSRPVNDIALIELNFALDFIHDPSVVPICLPVSHEDVGHSINDSMEFLGWGALDRKAKRFPQLLQHITLEVIPFEKWRQANPNNIDEPHDIFARSVFSSMGNADSGGPLVRTNSSSHPKHFTVFGVFSASFDDRYFMFTDVHKYLNWIRIALKGELPKNCS